MEAYSDPNSFIMIYDPDNNVLHLAVIPLSYIAADELGRSLLLEKR